MYQERRTFDLRSDYRRQFLQILRETYPGATKGLHSSHQNPEVLRMAKYFQAGIPFDYLMSEWRHYQSSDRDALHKVMEFAQNLNYHAHTGGGLVLIGGHGTGKSFLSYMCAIEAIRKLRLSTLCFSVREWVDKKLYQKYNPQLFEELLWMLDAARVVVVDNLSREGDRVGWGAEDLFEIIDRTTAGGKRKRALILNTSMTKDQYRKQAGGSALSRTRGFVRVSLKVGDFRVAVDTEAVLKYRSRNLKSPRCYTPLPFTKDKDRQRMDLPGACAYCVYSSKPRLCELRTTKKWIELKWPTKKP